MKPSAGVGGGVWGGGVGTHSAAPPPCCTAPAAYLFDPSWQATLVPRCCDEISNLKPRWPKRAHLVAKIAQNTPPEPPTRPFQTRKCGQNEDCCSFSYFDHFSKDRPQDDAKYSKSLPKWPQDGHLGPNLDHLGAILAPTWPLWARFSTIRARPKSAKTAFE